MHRLGCSATHGISNLEGDCNMRFLYPQQQKRHGTSGRLARNDTAVVTSRSSSYARHLARNPQ